MRTIRPQWCRRTAQAHADDHTPAYPSLDPLVIDRDAGRLRLGGDARAAAGLVGFPVIAVIGVARFSRAGRGYSWPRKTADHRQNPTRDRPST